MIALVLIGWEYAWFRVRLPFSLREKLLTLVVVALLPALTLTTAQGVTTTQMKRVEFCGSCHEMEAFKADLTNPKSKSLAALHVRNHRVDPDKACSVCHSTYAMLGPIKDKIRGLRHLHASLTPKGRGDLALYEPFPNANCLQCHGGAEKFERQEAHAAVMEELKSEGISCLSCHDNGGHAAEAKKRK